MRAGESETDHVDVFRRIVRVELPGGAGLPGLHMFRRPGKRERHPATIPKNSGRVSVTTTRQQKNRSGYENQLPNHSWNFISTKSHIRLTKPPSSTASITSNGRCSITLPLSWKSIVPTTWPFFSGAVSCGSVSVQVAFRFFN